MIRPIVLISRPRPENGLSAVSKLLAGDSPFQDSLERLSNDDLFLAPQVFVPDDLYGLCEEQVQEIDFEIERLCTYDRFGDIADDLPENDVFLILSAEYMVQDAAAFERACEEGCQAVEKGYVVCFAMMADFAETPATYLRVGPRLEAGYGGHALGDVRRVDDPVQAKIFVESGQFVQFSKASLLGREALLQLAQTPGNSLEAALENYDPKRLCVSSLLTACADLSTWPGVWKAMTF